MRPGWLVALCAAILAVSVWLPWLTTSANGGGRVSAIGGTAGNVKLLSPGFSTGQLIALLASMLIIAGAMVGRGISIRLASAAGLALSLLIAGLTAWYYTINVGPPIAPGYGFYLGAVMAVAAVACSVWAVIAAIADARR